MKNKFFSTGLTGLDIILSGKGYPIGSIVEAYGSEGASKSTLATYLATAFLKAFPKGKVLWIDTEGKTDFARFSAVWEEQGFILSDLIENGQVVFAETPYIEEGKKALDDAINNLHKEKDRGGKGLFVVWDSVAGTTSTELEGKGFAGAKLSAMWSSFLKGLSSKLKAVNGSLLLLNQVRDNISTGRGLLTPGGRAIRHHAVIRLKLSKAGEHKIKAGDFEVQKGLWVEIETTKNQMFIPKLKTLVYIDNEYGVSRCKSIEAELRAFNLITKSGAWKYLQLPDGEALKWQTSDQFCKLLQENPALEDKIADVIKNALAQISPLARKKILGGE